MNIEKLLISENLTIRDALKKLDETGRRILLITESEVLKAVITDGDIRRWILKNGDLNVPVKAIMNCSPITLTDETKYLAKTVMKEKVIEAIPILDKHGELKSIIFWNEDEDMRLKERIEINNPVVIMAGGLGTRLYPYTKILPKPLIPVGDTPIIERIINKFNQVGCNNFYLTVNYKKNMIKSYFNEIEKDYNIFYVEESKPLGTGGSLSLLEDKINETFFLTNCDIIVNSDYQQILRYHKENKNLITVVTAVKNFVIPYGVIKLKENGLIDSVKEKPEYSFLTNTGFYVIEPEVIKDIPKDIYYNLPDIISRYISENKKVGVYPISEKSWMDMGQLDELEDMKRRLGVTE